MCKMYNKIMKHFLFSFLFIRNLFAYLIVRQFVFFFFFGGGKLLLAFFYDYIYLPHIISIYNLYNTTMSIVAMTVRLLLLFLIIPVLIYLPFTGS